MKAPRVFLLFPVALSILLSSCAQHTDVEAAKRAIEEADARQVKAFAAKDLAGMIANYAPDAVILAPNTPAVTGRDNVEAFFREMSGMMDEFTFSMTTFDASGDLAYEIGTYSGSFGGMRDTGKYLSVWKKQPHGKWMIVADIFNTDLPPPMGSEGQK